MFGEESGPCPLETGVLPEALDVKRADVSATITHTLMPVPMRPPRPIGQSLTGVLPASWRRSPINQNGCFWVHAGMTRTALWRCLAAIADFILQTTIIAAHGPDSKLAAALGK